PSWAAIWPSISKAAGSPSPSTTAPPAPLRPSSTARAQASGSCHALRWPELVAALSRPRRILLMVQAGAPVDAVLANCSRCWIPATPSWTAAIRSSPIPSAVAGKRKTPACCTWEPACRAVTRERCAVRAYAGGSEAAYDGKPHPDGDRRHRWMAARAARTSAPGGAGHYVKMVHNGIEYGDMQLIAETFSLLQQRVRHDLSGDAGTLRGLEPRRSGLVPDRDHGADPGRYRPGNGRADGGGDPGQGRSEGYGDLDRAVSARTGRPRTHHCRGGVRTLAIGCEAGTSHRRRCPPRSRDELHGRSSRPCRRDRARALRREDLLLRSGVCADADRCLRVRMAARLWGHRHDLAWRLHHPRPLSAADQRSLRPRAEPGQSDARPVLRRCAAPRAVRLA
ncbi:6-phosphogluconate dehydrogenase, decarboxylating, partial [Geodia barretti]